MGLRSAAPHALLGLVLLAACAHPPKSGEAHPGRTAEDGARPRSAGRPAIPALPPPPTITAAMPGDPSGKALADARLVSASCEKVSTEQIEAKVREMRAAVDAMYREWHATQPQCWEDDREQYRMRKEIESGGGRAYAPRPSMQSGDTFSLSDAMASSAARAPSAAPAPSATATASPAGPPAKNAAAKKPGEPAAARSASGTNNQVVGVDEADIVKTDGRYVYLAANGALRIVEALDPRVVSVTRIGGVTRELFVEGDRAVVYTSSGGSGARCTYGYDCAFGGDGTSTKITVLDISDRKAPKTVREMDLSGSLLTARRIGNAIHTVVADPDRSGPGYATWPDDIGMCGVMENVVRAKLAKLKADNERAIRAQTTVTAFPTVRENGAERAMCTGGGLLRTAMRDGQAFTSVVSFDLADAKAPPATATIQSRPGAVFASGGALYLSVTHQRPEGGRWYSSYAATPEASEIHKFRIGASPRETRYVGSGLVPGHVLSQFAMDEWFGYLRVATTKGRVPDPGVSSVVSILAEGEEGNLVRVGAIDKIAPGEDIRAVRFDDDRGYVVTFKKTDPLFVMDLYQPAHPKILGELKIPGFSTYMHRIDRDHLLSIGFDANDHGDFAYFDGVILQLFDVKSPTDPRLVHKEKIGTRGSSSQAAADHLAFNYFADRGLLAVPMTVCDGGSDGVNGSLVSFSGLYVYDVSPETGFKRLGGVSHGSEGVSCGTWWSSATSAVKRSVFLDDLVYSIASDRVKVQNMSHFGKDVADIALTP